MTEDRNATPASDIAAQLDAEYQRLLAASARSTDLCLAAKVIALADPRVRERLVKRLTDGDRFRRIECSAAGRVRVEFDGPEGELRFVSPALVIDVDHIRQEVLTVEEVAHGGGFSSDIDLVAARRLDEHDVAIRLIGGLRRAQVWIEGTPITLRGISGGAGGKGRVRVQPPSLDVDIDVSTGPYVTVTVIVTLNKRDQQQQVYVHDGREQVTLHFPLTGFAS